MTEAKQHHKPCGTCPFTRAFEPDLAPGGSPLKVYVAQHFMPFQVPCHECVDYEQDDGSHDPDHMWKREAVKQAQCVGFAQCRNGDGVDKFMPDGLLHEEFDEESGAFKDIWDFYAHHRQISRREALIEVHPSQVEKWCFEELQRAGRFGLQGSTTSAVAKLITQAGMMCEEAWKKAIECEWDELDEVGAGDDPDMRGPNV